MAATASANIEAGLAATTVALLNGFELVRFVTKFVLALVGWNLIPPADAPAAAQATVGAQDTVGQRDRDRAVEARWFIVGMNSDAVLMADRGTLERSGQKRTGWTMTFHFQDGKVDVRGATNEQWDCGNRTERVLAIQTYDAKGTPDPMDTTPARTEPVVPETLGEDVLNFVCDKPIAHRAMPMPVSRDPMSAAEILAAYVEGGEVTVLGMLLGTLDPTKDEERLRALLAIESPAKRAMLSKLIWKIR